MIATDVADTPTLALRSSGLERVRVRHRPRLLSDNGLSYLSAHLASWLAEHEMAHTQGQLERYHHLLKNQIRLEIYYLPGQLETRLAEFVDHYNNCHYHKSLNNLPPADVYFGRAQTILASRQKIKPKTIEVRHRLYHQVIALNFNLMAQVLYLRFIVSG